MATVVPLPRQGEVFLDVRGEGRTLRLSWHHERDVVVLSLWRQSLCCGSFRLAAADVPQLITALVQGLSAQYGARHADAG